MTKLTSLFPFALGLAFALSILDAFVFTPNVLGWLCGIPWLVVILLGIILVIQGIRNELQKRKQNHS